MATKDTVVQELIVNTLTHKQFKAAQEAGTLSPYEFYGTPDTSVRLPVLTPMWFDHIANDVSWLRADTFSWHGGDVYVAAYEHLVADIDGAIIETETIGDITITYYRAEDKHKICLPGQEANLSALYEATGVAWYYILDTENKQFKLPRTKWGFTGLRDTVGGYVAPGLPNVTGTPIQIVTDGLTNSTPAYSALQVANHSSNNRAGGNLGFATEKLSLDASKSNSIYGNSDTVQQPATQMYLYFYVGNFEQAAVEQTAGLNTELFNGKADRDLSNLPINYDYIVERQESSAENNYTWYFKLKSGWVIMGGNTNSVTSTGQINCSATLPVPVISAPTVLATPVYQSGLSVVVVTSYRQGNTIYVTLEKNNATNTSNTTASARWFAVGIAE